MRPSLLLAGDDITLLGRLMSMLDPTAFEAYLLADALAVHNLAHSEMPESELTLIVLDGTENLADVRSLLAAHRDTRFLFLAPDYPPTAALARVVAAHGGAVLPKSEAPVVVAATLVAMLKASP
jgi:hypothetical protein